MSNFFQHFLIILIIISSAGCSKAEKVNPIISQCAEYTLAAETLTLNNFDKNKFADLLILGFINLKIYFLRLKS